jgi:hypothetical protein
MWSLVRDELADRLRDDPRLRAIAPQPESDVRSGALSAGLAPARLVTAFLPARGAEREPDESMPSGS